MWTEKGDEAGCGLVLECRVEGRRAWRVQYLMLNSVVMYSQSPPGIGCVRGYSSAGVEILHILSTSLSTPDKIYVYIN